MTSILLQGDVTLDFIRRIMILGWLFFWLGVGFVTQFCREILGEICRRFRNAARLD